MNEALLAIMATLIAAQVWLVKAITSRSDRLVEQRDREVSRLIESLEAAVDAFKGFELEASEAFGKLLDRLDGSQQAQEGILRELRAMRERLPAAAKGDGEVA